MTVPDRVVPVSASQSLHASSASRCRGAVSTGLPHLDWAIYPGLDGNPTGLKDDRKTQGVPSGRVTEIFGPPGAGKTSLA